MQYFAPTDLNDALTLMASAPMSVVAGGTDYFPAKPAGALRQPIVDITRIAELAGIGRTKAGGTRIGAATRWSDLAKADLPRCFDGLKAAARQVGSLQIQNAGTVAGNICNASPAADGVPPLLTLGAQVELSNARGSRMLPLAEFLTGVRQSLLQTDELMTAIILPAQPSHAIGGFDKLGSRAYLVISIAMVAILIGRDLNGRIDVARIAVGACSPVAQRLSQLEKDLIGQRLDQAEVMPHHLAALSPIDDVRGSAEYRRTIVAAQITRSIKNSGGDNG